MKAATRLLLRSGTPLASISMGKKPLFRDTRHWRKFGTPILTWEATSMRTSSMHRVRSESCGWPNLRWLGRLGSHRMGHSLLTSWSSCASAFVAWSTTMSSRIRWTSMLGTQLARSEVLWGLKLYVFVAFWGNQNPTKQGQTYSKFPSMLSPNSFKTYSYTGSYFKCRGGGLHSFWFFWIRFGGRLSGGVSSEVSSDVYGWGLADFDSFWGAVGLGVVGSVVWCVHGMLNQHVGIQPTVFGFSSVVIHRLPRPPWNS